MVVVTRSRSRSASAEPLPPAKSLVPRRRARRGRQQKPEPEPVANLVEETIPEEEERHSESNRRSDDVLIIQHEEAKVQEGDDDKEDEDHLTNSVLVKTEPQGDDGEEEGLSAINIEQAFSTIHVEQVLVQAHHDDDDNLSDIMAEQDLVQEDGSDSDNWSDIIFEQIMAQEDYRDHDNLSDIVVEQVLDQEDERDYGNLSDIMAEQVLVQDDRRDNDNLSDIMVKQVLVQEDRSENDDLSDIIVKEVLVHEDSRDNDHLSDIIVKQALVQEDGHEEDMLSDIKINEAKVQDNDRCHEGVIESNEIQVADVDQAAVQVGRESSQHHPNMTDQAAFQSGRESPERDTSMANPEDIHENESDSDESLHLANPEAIYENESDSDESLHLVPTVREGSISASLVSSRIYKSAARYIRAPLVYEDVAQLAQLMYEHFDDCNIRVSGGSRVEVSLRLLSHDIISNSHVVQKACPLNFAEQLRKLSTSDDLTASQAEQVENGVNLLLMAQVVANSHHAKVAGLPEYSSGVLFNGEVNPENAKDNPETPQDMQLTKENKERHTAMAGRAPKLGRKGASLLNIEPAMIQKPERFHKEYPEPPSAEKYGLLGRVEAYLAKQPPIEYMGKVKFSDLVEQLEATRRPARSNANGQNGGTSTSRPARSSASGQNGETSTSRPARSSANGQNGETSASRPHSGVVRRSPLRAAGSHPYQRRPLTIEVNNNLQLPQQGTPDTEFWRLHGASAAASTAANSPTGVPKENFDALQQYCGSHLGLDLSLLYSTGSFANKLLRQGRRLLSRMALRNGLAEAVAEQQKSLVMVADFMQHTYNSEHQGHGGVSPAAATFVEISDDEDTLGDAAPENRGQRGQLSSSSQVPAKSEETPEFMTPPPAASVSIAANNAAAENARLGIERYYPNPPHDTSTTFEESRRFFRAYRHVIPRRYGGMVEDTPEPEMPPFQAEGENPGPPAGGAQAISEQQAITTSG